MSMPPDCFDRQRLTCPGGPQHGARWHTGLQPRAAASAAARRAPRRQRTAPRAALVHPPPAPPCRPAPSSTAPSGCQLRCLVTSEPCEDCVVHPPHCRAARHTASALVGEREGTIGSSQAGFLCISSQQDTPRCPELSAAVNHWPLSSCPQNISYVAMSGLPAQPHATASHLVRHPSHRVRPLERGRTCGGRAVLRGGCAADVQV